MQHLASQLHLFACRHASQQLRLLQAWHRLAQHKRQLKVKGLHAWYLYCLNVLSKALRGWRHMVQRRKSLAGLLLRAQQQHRRAVMQRGLAAWQDWAERRHLQCVLQDSALQQRRRRLQQEVLLAWGMLAAQQVGAGHTWLVQSGWRMVQKPLHITVSMPLAVGSVASMYVLPGLM